MVERAGKSAVKYFAYTSFIAAKSVRLVRNTVDFTTLANVSPWSSRMAFTFCSTRSVCTLASPATRSPVAGSRGICPAQNSRSPTRTAWLYGPTALGDFAGLMICLVAINRGARSIGFAQVGQGVPLNLRTGIKETNQVLRLRVIN